MIHRPVRAGAAFVLLAVACGDAPTEPAASIVAEHARAALDVPVPLPSLADARSMDAARFDGVLGDLRVWLDVADARLDRAATEPALAPLRAAVAEGRALLGQAERLEADGERDAAVAALLGAEARLLRTTTRAVAERRLADASAAGARCGDVTADVRASVNVERGLHLLAHAREAMREGDAERALQRAHYAVALLDGACGVRPGSTGGER